MTHVKKVIKTAIIMTITTKTNLSYSYYYNNKYDNDINDINKKKSIS